MFRGRDIEINRGRRAWEGGGGRGGRGRERGREKRKKIGGEDRSGVTAVRGRSTLQVYLVIAIDYWQIL